MKEFTPEELRAFSGEDNAPAYIAYRGKVYDVSGSKLWKAGRHMMKHNAGRDLENEIKAAPHGPEVLDRVPQVGILRGVGPEAGERRPAGFLDRHPSLIRHPHPATVHFPIALIVAALAFEALGVPTRDSAFRTSSLHCLGLGLLSVPFAIATGYLSWSKVYLCRPVRQIKIKKALSWVLLPVAALTFGTAPLLPGPGDYLYLALLSVLVALVSVIGYYGGQLTIPK